MTQTRNKKFKIITKDGFSNTKEVDNFFYFFQKIWLEFGRKIKKTKGYNLITME